ncbi:MAG: hypothetical protein P4M07_06650, partial [Xanthobacteraceae bacterium]|nr:hypothetical protein [Xanthobacteraceae bacterium]
DANKIVKSPLAFARLIKTNLMQRRGLGELLKPPPEPQSHQARFDFGHTATRAAHRRQQLRAAHRLMCPA